MSWKRYLRFAAHAQLLPVLESGEETLIGGQAVMEGVMMRAPHSYSIAVRRASGEIVTETQSIGKVSDKYPIFKYPVLRGLGTLGQAMSLGYKSLQFSANVALEDEEAKEAAAKQTKTGVTSALWSMGLGGAVSSGGGASGGKMGNLAMAGQLAFSLLFFIVAYKFVPLWITTWLSKSFPVLQGQIAFNFVDGVIRIAIFLAFLFGLSRFKDIHRVFEYHGAEHKVVFNFESRKEVTVPNAQSFPTWHPRCGTSFLITLMIISMAIYTVLPFTGFWERFASRIVLIPVIAGLSYEVIRFAARRQSSLFALMTAPGLWLQRITTQPPDDRQAEIAIVALQNAMEHEKAQGGELVIA